jgi:Protein of unknown function (DUF2934)
MSDTHRNPTHEEIATRAYEIFEERGAIAGDDVSHWLEAEQELSGASQAGEIGESSELHESRSKAEPKIVDSPISAPNVTGLRSRATVA